MWVGDTDLSKSVRKAEADSGKLTHGEKQEKNGNCSWDPTRRPLNTRRKGVCSLSQHHPEVVGVEGEMSPGSHGS